MLQLDFDMLGSVVVFFLICNVKYLLFFFFFFSFTTKGYSITQTRGGMRIKTETEKPTKTKSL